MWKRNTGGSVVMLAIFDPLRDLTFPAILFRFCLATACSALIGFERGRKRHEAGLRTHMVVCIGAASVMLLNQYLLVYYNPNADPARLGAQVI
ncbi:MAG: MgtC/SapB family protein, partial [Clostridiales bacterium]|nr:MgtC/SapB family protein [Clostridiales bacterium]